MSDVEPLQQIVKDCDAIALYLKPVQNLQNSTMRLETP
jgi:hypothetical protein